MNNPSLILFADSSDSLENPLHPNSIPRRDVESSYPEIGSTLLQAEKSYLNVGIPILPTRSLFSKDKPQLNQFLKESLVNINTKALDSYCLDLQRPQLEFSSDKLYIEISKTQRYFFSLATTILATILIIPSLSISGLSMSMSLIIGLFFVSFVAFASCETVRDSYRRASFSATLELELNRRRGGGNGVVSTTLSLSAVKTTPLLFSFRNNFEQIASHLFLFTFKSKQIFNDSFC